MIKAIQLEISLPKGTYPITIHPNRFDLSVIQPELQGRKVMIVSNEIVAPLYLSTVSNLFTENQVFHSILLR